MSDQQDVRYVVHIDGDIIRYGHCARFEVSDQAVFPGEKALEVTETVTDEIQFTRRVERDTGRLAQRPVGDRLR